MAVTTQIGKHTITFKADNDITTLILESNMTLDDFLWLCVDHKILFRTSNSMLNTIAKASNSYLEEEDNLDLSRTLSSE